MVRINRGHSGARAVNWRSLLVLSTAVGACAGHVEPARGQRADSGGALVPDAQSEPSWSHDGSRIAFRGGAYPEVDIWVAAADGTSPVRLTDHPAADTYPVWSPDDRSLAFVSNRSGAWTLYVMNADGSGIRELAQTSRHEQDPARPAWTPDGEALIIRVRDADETTRLVAVPAAGGELREIDAPDGADWPDVAPDESRSARRTRTVCVRSGYWTRSGAQPARSRTGRGERACRDSCPTGATCSMWSTTPERRAAGRWPE